MYFYRRLSRTVNIMLYLIHISACAYYAFSDYEGIASSPYVFDGEGNAYIRFVQIKLCILLIVIKTTVCILL